MKKQFALIGHPVLHSISPFIHNRLFELSQISAEYKLLDIPPAKFQACMAELKYLDGYNVTIPYKEKVLPFIDKLDSKAALYGCVNTVKNFDGLCGYNTDAYGFLKALEFEKIPLNGHITILGCGGAARVCCFEAALLGGNVTVAVRAQSFSKALQLQNDVKKVTGKTIAVTHLDNLPLQTDLLINATPVGMYPDYTQMPISSEQLKNCSAVFDAIYNPTETLLIKSAKRQGLQVVSGLSMLIYQAASAHAIWTNATFNNGDILQLISDAKEILKNYCQ